MMDAVTRQPSRSASGSTAQAMAGTSTRAPRRLPTLAHATAVDRLRRNQLFSAVTMGIQLPSPLPKDMMT